MLNLNHHPQALKRLFFTEMWERFSFYGLNAIVILYITKVVGIPENTALIITGSYITYVYLSTTIAGYLADRLFGFYRVVFIGGIFIFLGHISLAISAMSFNLFYFGLGLIATGTGLLKPNVSVMVGKLYGDDEEKRSEGFNIYYLGINIGAFIAPFIVGFVAQKVNWHLGFGLAAIGMFIGLVVFKMGYKIYPDNCKEFRAEKLDKTYGGIKLVYWIYVLLILISLFFALVLSNPVESGLVMTVCLLALVVYIFTIWKKLDRGDRRNVGFILLLSLFSLTYWTLSNQVMSSIPLLVDRVVDRSIFGFNFPASSIGGFYSLLLIIFAPIIGWIWMYLAKIGRNPNYAEKFVYGLVAAALAFIVLLVGIWLNVSVGKISIIWVLLCYAFLVFGELFISPNGLALVTSYAPKHLTGVMMGLWWMINAFAGYTAALVGKTIGFQGTESLSVTAQLKIFESGYFRVCIGVVIACIILLALKKYFKR